MKIKRRTRIQKMKSERETLRDLQTERGQRKGGDKKERRDRRTQEEPNTRKKRMEEEWEGEKKGRISEKEKK